jgi:hypothetical protein
MCDVGEPLAMRGCGAREGASLPSGARREARRRSKQLSLRALCIGVRGEHTRQKQEACGRPHRSEFSFHFIVPFEPLSCDSLWANAKDAMAISE